MRIALISDIHGNLEALNAVLIDVKHRMVDKIYCLGDVIGYGCNPVECLDLIEENCQVKLMGNHEYLILGLADNERYNAAAIEAIEWTRAQLDDRRKAMIEKYQMDVSEGDLYFVHASPWEPLEWHYVLNTNQASRAFEHLQHRVAFIGHSHVPMLFLETADGRLRQQAGHDILVDPESRYIINVGSVGQPRDSDPRACYAIIDTATDDLYYHRVEYDIDTTQEKMASARIPDILIQRLSLGR